MAYVISDSCVSCGTCEGECPVGLSLQEMENTKSLLILASSVELVQVLALQELSARNNFRT